MFKKYVSICLQKLGLFEPAHKIYNAVGRFHRKTEIVIDNRIIKFWTPTYYLDHYIKNSAWEEQFFNEILSRLDKFNILWDVGANLGFYSVIAAKVMHAHSKIFSFEPEPKGFKLLRRNIELNKVKNVTALPIALGDTNGIRILYPSDTDNFGTNSFLQRTDDKVKQKGKSVNVNTADWLIDELKIDVPEAIKIDVEGAEILVLKGMKRLLTNPKLKTIFCEVHANLLPLFGSSEEELLEIFKKENFRIDYLLSRGNQNQFIFSR